MGCLADFDARIFASREQLIFHTIVTTQRNMRNDAILFNCLLLVQRLCAANAVDMYVHQSELEGRNNFLKLTYATKPEDRPEVMARCSLGQPQNVVDIDNQAAGWSQ